MTRDTEDHVIQWPDDEDRPPDGFVFNPTRGPFSAHNGPFYDKEEPGCFRRGFRARKRHCNGHGIVHGGLLMAFADSLLAGAAWLETRKRIVTIRMTSDFLSMARPGDWVEGAGGVTRATRSIVFTEAQIQVGDRLVLTASGLFKTMRRRAD